ncbi:MAG: I78 family peptidase inhibitor [Hyphomonadaceae bacterium]
MRSDRFGYLCAYVALSLGLATAACTPKTPDAVQSDAVQADAVQPVAGAESSTEAAAPEPPITDADGAGADADAGEDTCGRQAHAGLVGRPFDAAEAPAPSATVRYIRPGTQVTMDYRIDRLNIEIDENGMVAALRCG